MFENAELYLEMWEHLWCIGNFVRYRDFCGQCWMRAAKTEEPSSKRNIFRVFAADNAIGATKRSTAHGYVLEGNVGNAAGIIIGGWLAA